MIRLDESADTFPVGLQGTPFEEVYKALRTVAASVWAVDPTVYRAGMAWGWYALHKPEALAAFHDVVAAALISAFAPMLKDDQTDAELVEYLRMWRVYKPTFGALGELFSAFGASVEVRAISDEESQSVAPVDDTRLAFYLRIEGIDFSRPLALSEAVEIARGATPLGSRPFAYYAIPSRISVPCGPAPEPAWVFVENDEVAQLPPLGYILVDGVGKIVYGVQRPAPTMGEVQAITVAINNPVAFQSIQANAISLDNAPVFVENEPEPDYLDVFFYYNGDGTPVIFDENDYWASCIIDDNDKALLESFGVSVSDYAGDGKYVLSRTNNEGFTYTPLGLYSGLRTGDLNVDMGVYNFRCGRAPGDQAGKIYYGICILNSSACRTSTTVTWKCRITRNS